MPNENPRNGERLIITAKYLVETFGKYDAKTALFILTGFAQETDAACLAYFAARAEELTASVCAAELAHVEAIAFWDHLLRAYKNMSVFERSAVRKDLPRVYADYLKKGLK